MEEIDGASRLARGPATNSTSKVCTFLDTLHAGGPLTLPPKGVSVIGY